MKTCATIENNVVTNISVGEINSNSIYIDDLPVRIGDTYDGKYFYHDGERIYSIADTHFQELKMIRDILGISLVEEDD